MNKSQHPANIHTCIEKTAQLMRVLYQKIGRIWFNQTSVKRFAYLCFLGAILSVVISACAGSYSATEPEIKLRLVSFSVTKAAHDQIIPKFVEKWQKEHNQKVVFDQSYGGSVAQAADVISGKQEADIVHLALPLDVLRIQQAGLIKSSWQIRTPRNGIVSKSVAAIVTREGNPKKIQTWADLAKDNVQLIAANPKTSGIGIWELLAFWGSVTQNGGDEATALNYIAKVYQNAAVLTKDAREASDVFFQKAQGDVLITYENEVNLAEKTATKLPYVIPELNISIDNPVAVVDKNVDQHKTRKVAEAFVDFLYSSEAQREFAKLQYRPVNPTVTQEVISQYPPIQTLFTAQDLGGWDIIQTKFLNDGAIFDKIKANSKA
ncbi:sulfate ABC transporter substrate-binding protein [Aulosira sp. FACHB-615]|nr:MULTISPECIES: sulfate ABC transporter substrate-binding protein [Nostocales]MBD2301364.1 sulfate ABC transporter substrate-binding protein [Nostoc sp. FACHB-190]MBD2486748.1 sulfate ABC transporter substrate-binding protein [Aulosira sp. FACHB-615]